MLLLKNCKVLPALTEGYSSEVCDILVDGQKIFGIYECGKAPEDSKDLKVLDVNGKTVLPGFFDLHVHLSHSGGDILVDNTKLPAELTLEAVKYVKDTLDAGFTTIRDVGSTYQIGTSIRDAIANGLIVGPTVYACGAIITPTEIGNEFYADMYKEADTEDEIKKAVRYEMQKGADFIKIMGTGAVMNPGGEPGQPIYTFDELKAVVDAARFKNAYVATHCHGTKAIKDSIRAGVRTIEHASILDDEAVEMLVGNTDTYIVPTLEIVMGIAEAADAPESSTFMKEKTKALLDSLRYGIRKAYDAGLLLGFGTDTGSTPVRHGDNALEFVMRKEFWGMDELDIIKQATINSAIIIGQEKDYGTIKAGKYADLVVVDGNPLEDISVLCNKIEHVIKFGQVVK